MTQRLPNGPLRIWCIGRHPVAALVTLAFGFLICGYWWYAVFPTRLFGQFEPRWVQVIEAAPLVAGIVALAALAPRNPRIDRVSEPKRRAVSTLAAAVVVIICATMPTLVVFLLDAVPTHWVPRYELYGFADSRFLDVVKFHSVFVFTTTILGIVGTSAGLIAILGMVRGSSAAILLYPALVIIQSTPINSLTEPVPVILWFALSLTLAVGGITTWHRTGAGAHL